MDTLIGMADCGFFTATLQRSFASPTSRSEQRVPRTSAVCLGLSVYEGDRQVRPTSEKRELPVFACYLLLRSLCQ